MAATGMATRRAGELTPRHEAENLPALFSRLGTDVTELFDTKMALFKAEVREEVHYFARASTLIAIGAIIAAIGFALMNVAVALAISALFANSNLSQAGKYALGFVITGALYLIIGGVMAAVMKGRLAKQEIVPQASVAELRKDRQWLKNEL